MLHYFDSHFDLFVCHARPFVRAKGGRGKPFPIEEVALRTVPPGVADRHRGRDARVGNNYRIAIDFRLGPVKLSVRTRDSKSSQSRSSFRLQSAANVAESNPDL